MDVKVIRNDEDHAEALSRIAQLWGAQEGSPEGDELDILATLVERYEDRVFPVELDADRGAEVRDGAERFRAARPG